MSLTSEQRSAIANQLSVSLNTVTDERLIELCLLHDSAPDVRPEFAQALNIEISRRFDAIKIASDPTIFSVAQSFADKFKLPKNLNESQKSAITAQLSTDLSTVDDGKLIELCVLYRSNLTLYPEFYDALKSEITRRFTSSAINTDSTTFAAVQILANNFGGEVPDFARKMSEMMVSVDRDIWFQTNSAYMTLAAENKGLMAWLMMQTSIISAVLSTATGVAIIGNSKLASTELFDNSNSYGVWKSISGILVTWAAFKEGMRILAKNSSDLRSMLVSSEARAALMQNNAVFQDIKVVIYDTVKAAWSKNKEGGNQGKGVTVNGLNASMTSPIGFVFVTFGKNYQDAVVSIKLKHPNSTEAARGGKYYLSLTKLEEVSAVSFSGATFDSTGGNDTAYFELWTPPV